MGTYIGRHCNEPQLRVGPQCLSFQRLTLDDLGHGHRHQLRRSPLLALLGWRLNTRERESSQREIRARSLVFKMDVQRPSRIAPTGPLAAEAEAAAAAAAATTLSLSPAAAAAAERFFFWTNLRELEKSPTCQSQLLKSSSANSARCLGTLWHQLQEQCLRQLLGDPPRRWLSLYQPTLLASLLAMELTGEKLQNDCPTLLSPVFGSLAVSVLTMRSSCASTIKRCQATTCTLKDCQCPHLSTENGPLHPLRSWCDQISLALGPAHVSLSASSTRPISAAKSDTQALCPSLCGKGRPSPRHGPFVALKKKNSSDPHPSRPRWRRPPTKLEIFLRQDAAASGAERRKLPPTIAPAFSLSFAFPTGLAEDLAAQPACRQNLKFFFFALASPCRIQVPVPNIFPILPRSPPQPVQCA